IGEKVGSKHGPEVDIAVDPLEGTTLCAKNMPGAIATMAMAEAGTLLNAPDVYMEKIAIGPGYPKGIVDLDAPAEQNIRELAKAKGIEPAEITALILDRPRQAQGAGAGRAPRADPRRAAPCRSHRGRAQGGRSGAAHHRWRRRGRDPYRRSCRHRHRHLYGHRRGARRGAGRRGAALHRRPDGVSGRGRHRRKRGARWGKGDPGTPQERRDRRHGEIRKSHLFTPTTHP